MREAIELEIGIQLGVQAQEEILVERRGQAQGIVIGEQQVALGLDEVDAEQQVVVRLKGRANQPEKSRRAWRVEVAEVRSEEGDERRVRALGRQHEQAVFVGGLVRRDADLRVVDRGERLHRSFQRRLGKIDQVRVDVPDPGVGQQRGELLAVAAAQLDDPAASAECPPNRRRVLLKQPQLGARDAVPRQVTNRVEQRGAQRVVQEP